MYPAVLPNPAAPKLQREFEHVASTEPRFGFDAFCKVQLLLVHEPIASGVVMWFGHYPEDSVELDVVNPIMLADFSSCAASGALAVDAGQLFTSERGRLWSTPLRPTWHTLWLDISRPQFRKNWVLLNEIVTFAPVPEVAATAPPEHARPSLPPGPKPAMVRPELVDIATPYSEILGDLIKCGPWTSRKKLGSVLGTSHTQIGRILKYDAVPNDEVAPRIDELHRFHQRLSRLTHADANATKRLLTTPRQRDGLSANDFLKRQDYRNAFRAVMEAASPHPEVAAVDLVPRRWYDEPSRDLFDGEVAQED